VIADGGTGDASVILVQARTRLAAPVLLGWVPACAGMTSRNVRYVRSPSRRHPSNARLATLARYPDAAGKIASL